MKAYDWLDRLKFDELHIETQWVVRKLVAKGLVKIVAGRVRVQ